ncbi:MAG: hypothetical protein V8R63_11735 [Thomasclavelia ramosa]
MENSYQKDNIFIEIDRDIIIKGKIMIKNKNEVISELPFVLGGNHNLQNALIEAQSLIETTASLSAG